MRNEKYFLVLLIYQLFGYYLFGQNPIEIIVDKIFVPDFAKIVTKQLIYKQTLKNISGFYRYCFFYQFLA